MASNPLTQRTDPLYQRDGQCYAHTASISCVQPFSSFPQEIQRLFKPPPGTNPYILTSSSTIFHPQGGGQPSDTGSISIPMRPGVIFHVQQVRKLDTVILHMGLFSPADASDSFKDGNDAEQKIDIDKRVLHSKIHTAGHVIGIAVNLLVAAGSLPASLLDGKASHYPGAAFVEFRGLISGDAKGIIQAKVNELIAQDHDVKICFWSEEQAQKDCIGIADALKGDKDEIRVVKIGDVGSYPCGGTHVLRLQELGNVIVRRIKRQSGISKISYMLSDI